jgi:hypothetical protein
MSAKSILIFVVNAMSTILTTSNTIAKPYTVIGGEKISKAAIEPIISVILLGRSGKFHREELLLELASFESVQVVYIEGPDHSYDIEPLSRKNPGVKFLLLHDNLSVGEKITLGFEESDASLCLVMWSDMRIIHLPLPVKFLEKIKSSEVFLTVPVMKNARSEIVPSILVPAIIRKHLQILPFSPMKDGIPSLFPFDFTGIYNKEKYTAIGGFDEKIKNPYWQKMDLGFRAFMWGEKIALASALTLQYTSALETEDSTPDAGYKFFFLKNMFVSMRKGEGKLNPFRVLHYMAKADSGPVKAWREFHEARAWVSLNSGRFKKDAKSLIKGWEPPE